MSCRPEGTVVRVDKDNFTTVDQVKIGRTLSRQIIENPDQYPIYKRNANPELYSYLDLVFETMVNTPFVEHRSDFPWTVYVLRDTQSMSAFSMPGGYVYITDGFLKFLKNEAQLFSVLSNEMYYSDQGVAMQLLQDNFSGLILGDIVFDNPVDELDNIITTLQLVPSTSEETKLADRFSIDVICPFQYAPDALTTVFELGLSDSDFPLEWSNIRPTYEDRIPKLISSSRECNAENKLFTERYQNDLIRFLDL